MRKITADHIFPVSSPPLKNGIIILDEKGIVLDVVSQDSGVNAADLEVYKGVITPGFINTHCHLELSHLKGQVTEHRGLTGFISELLPMREKFSAEQIGSAIVAAEDEMLRNGIVAVGDISNTDHSFEQKKKRKLAYHTFIEAFDLDPSKAHHTFEMACNLKSKIPNLQSSITPHAPYSVSGKLMELIDSLKQPILSIHNQESESENELFRSGKGLLAELMKKAGVDTDDKQRARNSLLYILGPLLETKKILLVHNTFSSKEDIELIRHYVLGGGCEVALCICPNANLYIENKLPDIPMFLEAEMKLTLGTDSYASNKTLSMLDEMKTIAQRYPQIPFETLLTWATKNGAEFLGMEKELGTIEKGKRPGLNLITGMDMGKMILSDSAVVQKLV